MPTRSPLRFVNECLIGSGQVMLQRSAGAGALFLAAIACGARTSMAIAAAVALLLCSALRRNSDGLSGFNALLTGCAAFALLVNGAATWALMLGAALLTLPLKAVLDRPLRRIGLTSLTLPFILATWLMLALAPLADVSPYIAEEIAEVPELTPLTLAAGWLKGLSQVFLVDSALGGALILAGLWLSSGRAALSAAIGSAAGMAVAALCGCPWAEIAGGLWGFSPALTAVALGTTRRPLIALAATLATTPLQLLLAALLPLPALTLPFCLATLLFSLKHKSKTK